MTEAIACLTDLTPLGAVLVIASILTVGITQLAKQQQWPKAQMQKVAAAVATVLGALAALVLGLIAGIPDSVLQIISSALLSIAAVAVLAKALYGVLGYVIPDGRAELSASTGDVQLTVNSTADPTAFTRAIESQLRGRHSDRYGVMDGQDTPTYGGGTGLAVSRVHNHVVLGARPVTSANVSTSIANGRSPRHAPLAPLR